MKKVLAVILCVVMLTTLVACSLDNILPQKNTIVGKYVSESGKYKVEFKEDNTCIWYEKFLETEYFFEGTYEKEGDIYKLHIKGDGLLAFNVVFEAEPVEGGLKITGGSVKGEIFTKQS